MNNAMTCKGYSSRIEYDDEDGILFGQIAGIRDGIGFHADTVADRRQAFHGTVDDCLETCAKVCNDPQKPYPGRVVPRFA